MPFTILADFAQVLTVLAIALLPVASLLSVPSAWDSSEPARALAVALALALVAIAARRVPGRMTRRAALILMGAALLVVLSAAVNGLASGFFGVPGRLQGVYSLFVLVSAAAVGVLAVSRRTQILAGALAIVSTAQVMLMLAQLGRGEAPVGTLGNGVPAGAFLAVSASIVIAAALTRAGNARLVFAGAALVAAAGVGLSGSRGALFGLIVGVLVALVAVRATLRRGSLVLALAALAVVVGVTLSGSVMTAKIGADGLRQGSAGSRLQIWRGTAEMIADHPVLGVGAGRFLYEFPAYQPLAHALIEDPDRRADQAHSLPLQMAAESGVPAALLFVVLVGLVLAAGIPAVRRRDGAAVLALAGFSAYGAQALFGVPSLGVDLLGWALGGVLLARGDAVAETSKQERGTGTRAGLATPVRGILVLAALLLGGVVVWYLVADAAHARGVAAFQRGEFETAFSAERLAITRNPLIDIYRVGLADAATYLGPEAVREARASLEEGLRLEPDSYDLHIARARLLASAGVPPTELADAYRSAVAAYPLGVTVNEEALVAFVAASASADATRSQETLRALGRRSSPVLEVTP